MITMFLHHAITRQTGRTTEMVSNIASSMIKYPDNRYLIITHNINQIKELKKMILMELESTCTPKQFEKRKTLKQLNFETYDSLLSMDDTEYLISFSDIFYDNVITDMDTHTQSIIKSLMDCGGGGNFFTILSECGELTVKATDERMIDILDRVGLPTNYAWNMFSGIYNICYNIDQYQSLLRLISFLENGVHVSTTNNLFFSASDNQTREDFSNVIKDKRIIKYINSGDVILLIRDNLVRKNFMVIEHIYEGMYNHEGGIRVKLEGYTSPTYISPHDEYKCILLEKPS